MNFKNYMEYLIFEDLNVIQMSNMIGHLKIPKELKKDYKDYSDLFNNLIILKLKLHPKQEKLLLFWLLTQVKNNFINSDKIKEDSEIILKHLNIYFTNVKEIKKQLNILNYKTLKDITSKYLSGKEVSVKKFLSKPIAEGKGYKIYEIKNVDTCIKIGKGTSWCIQGREQAEDYLSEGYLYLVTKNNKRFGLFHFETGSFMDINEEELDIEILREIRDMWPGSEEKAIKNINNDSINIIFIKNFSKDMQLKAVKENAPDIIKYIKNPDKDVQLAAVEQNGFAITYIKNPDKDIQLKAVKNIGSAIRYIKNPDKDVQLMAVEKNGFAIRYIKNPDKDVQLMAVEEARDAIEHIENPDKEVLDYVKRD